MPVDERPHQVVLPAEREDARRVRPVAVDERPGGVLPVRLPRRLGRQPGGERVELRRGPPRR